MDSERHGTERTGVTPWRDVPHKRPALPSLRSRSTMPARRERGQVARHAPL